MKVNKIYITLLLPLVLLLSIGFNDIFQKDMQPAAKLKTKQKVFLAGENVVLQFELDFSDPVELYVSSSYGQTVISSTTGDFTLPSFIISKTGDILYTLVLENNTLYTGSIEIIANTSTAVQLESYVGPPSIIAGGEDYTMQVIVPTDIYDNPLPDSTLTVLKHQFLDNEKEKQVLTKDMISWSTIYSYQPSGRILISSVVEQTPSKEFSIEVFPSLAQDFKIFSQRKHTYADGNQVAEFRTSIVRDSYNNIISDGTIVHFLITNSIGNLLQTTGSTINGEAVGKMLHPDKADSWQVKAMIPGIAVSDTIQVDYKAVLEDFEIELNKNNREVIVGPLLSFMNQLIPDGALVKVNILQDDKLLETKIGYSNQGKVRFRFQESFFSSGIYTIEIEAFGIKKILKQIHLK